MKTWKIVICAVFAVVLCLAAANKYTTPKSVLHIVTVQWKAESTPEQQTAAVEGVRKMAAQIPGVTRIWLKKIKVQPGDYSTLFVMEFKDQKAFDAYEDHPAHREWEKVYLPVRGQSRSHDVTN